jgi:hypothetical protein
MVKRNLIIEGQSAAKHPKKDEGSTTKWILGFV